MFKKASYEKLWIGSIAIATAIISLYAFKFFSILMPLLALILVWHQGNLKKLTLPNSLPFVFSFLLLILAGVSIFWVENKEMAFKTFSSLCITFIFSLLFISCVMRSTSDLSAKVYRMLLVAGFLLISLVIFQLIINIYCVEYFNKFVTAYSMIKPTGSIIGLFAFVGCAFLWINNNKYLSIYIYFLLLCIIYITKCQTAFYASFLGVCAFLVTYLMPIWVTRFYMVASYVFLLSTPVIYAYIVTPSRVIDFPIVSGVLNNSFFHRFLVWEWYAHQFFETPLYGWGLESGRYIARSLVIFNGYKMTIHAHNNSLQAFVELGIIGGILFALFLCSFFWIVGKNVKDRLSAAVCNATITYAFVEAQITHNLWRNYWLSLVTLVTGCIILFLKAREAQQLAASDHSGQLPDHNWVGAPLKFWKKKNDQEA